MSLERLGPKWLEIDLGQFRQNIETLKTHVAPAKLIPVIKANAYGHGAIEIARALERMSIDCVAVATLPEAIQLREAFIKMKILILGSVPSSEYADILIHNIIPTVCDYESARQLDLMAKKQGVVARIHFYVDTGMGRMGLPPSKALEEFHSIIKLENLRTEYAYTHFAVSDEKEQEHLDYTQKQHENLSSWKKSCHNAPLLHVANSGGVILHPYSFEDGVRPGLLCFGHSPNPDIAPPAGIKPILSIKCKPLFIKNMDAGTSIGYGRSFKLDRSTQIMTLPLGYADGIPRRLGQHLKVQVGSRDFSVVGRVCMDMLMVDIGNESFDTNCEVTVLSSDSDALWDWAKHTDTIPYELLTGLGRRWDRYYIEGDHREIVTKAG